MYIGLVDPFFPSQGISLRWVTLSDIDGESNISSQWVIFSEIDRESIRSDSLRTSQDIVSPEHQVSALLNNPDEASFEEAREHDEFLGKYLGERE